ncbi:hypothetical protein [Saccharopolyspora phatthalungensis]|uniref:Uncharacterized protein n=1 Tax=Saccharopolyspora phatthalungensis TaxID=664693 RepID=A0A840QK38_9PSEU|nr:hypothetical protein [Saccharopolyspora phatthalungensis]MBB5159898.1 hypothetical protein [Saccharopolyspora phatthalungensis]
MLSATDLAQVTGRSVRVSDVPAQRTAEEAEALQLLAGPAAYREAGQ